MRYRFYREHKFISNALYDLEKLISKTDFRDNTQIATVVEQLKAVEDMMQGHAEHEDTKIHALLRRKGSSVHLSIEAQHQQHVDCYQEFYKNLNQIIAIQGPKDIQSRLKLGYDFFLSYRLFMCENIRHLHEEEAVIMPELQRLYSDEELRVVEFDTYAQMTPAEMINMLEVLSPHMDPSDREFFIAEMKQSEPEKWEKALQMSAMSN